MARNSLMLLSYPYYVGKLSILADIANQYQSSIE